MSRSTSHSVPPMKTEFWVGGETLMFDTSSPPSKQEVKDQPVSNIQIFTTCYIWHLPSTCSQHLHFLSTWQNLCRLFYSKGM